MTAAISRWVSGLAQVVALCVLLANLVVALGSRSPRGGAVGPPAPWHQLLALPGVFAFFATNNTELSLWGLVKGEGSASPYWRELPVSEYFPYARGQQGKMLRVRRHTQEGGATGQRQAWERLGQQVLQRFNRERPGQPLTAVALQSVSWPSSPEGFYARQGEASRQRQFWIIAEAKP